MASLAALALGTGCGSGGGTDLLLNLDLLVATNTADTFSIAGVSTAFSGSRTYSWSCSRGQANVSIGATLTNGSIRLEVFDSTGALVHDNTYEAALIGGVTTVTKAAASAGTWTLKFTFDHALWSGALTVKADTLDESDAITIGGTGALNVVWVFRPGWTAAPVHVSIGGLSGGSVRVQLWDGAGASVYDQTVAGVSGITADISGAAGTWTAQIDFDHAVSAGGVTLTQP